MPTKKAWPPGTQHNAWRKRGGGDGGFVYTDVDDMAIAAAIALVQVELSACKNGCGMLQILWLYALWLQKCQIRTRAIAQYVHNVQRRNMK